jgi:hypothetical protein
MARTLARFGAAASTGWDGRPGSWEAPRTPGRCDRGAARCDDRAVSSADEPRDSTPEQPAPEQSPEPAAAAEPPAAAGPDSPAEPASPAEAASAAEPGPVVPQRLVFQPSRLTIVAVLAFCVFAVPFAFGAPWLWLVYLLPVALVVWIVRTRTTVDPEAVTVRRLLGGRRVRWDAISSLRLGKKSRVSAILNDGEELPLPAVRVRDLPVLAVVSGGRFTFPTDE